MTSLILSPKTRRDNATLIERIFARCHEHTPYPPPGDYAGSFDRAANSLEAAINCPLCRNVWAVTFPNIAMLTDMATRYGHLINDADSGEILWVLTCPRCIRHIDDPRAIYADYLRSPHWQSTRAAALDRADHRCQVCNSNKRLEVHHRSYARRGNELPADLVVLCDECHRLFHENREIAS